VRPNCAEKVAIRWWHRRTLRVNWA